MKGKCVGKQEEKRELDRKKSFRFNEHFCLPCAVWMWIVYEAEDVISEAREFL